jgi:hypothetical protein
VDPVSGCLSPLTIHGSLLCIVTRAPRRDGLSSFVSTAALSGSNVEIEGRCFFASYNHHCSTALNQPALLLDPISLRYFNQQFVLRYQFQYISEVNVMALQTFVPLKAFIDEHASIQSSDV